MTRRAVRVTDEIHQVGGSGLSAPEDAAVYLIEFDGHAALIDSGCGGGEDRLLASIEAVGVRPERIEALLITHCHYDHTGGAHALRKRLGCPVVAHQFDAPFIEQGVDQVTGATWYGASLTPCTVDRTLSGTDEAIDLGGRAITAIHIPGHSPGSVAYLVSSGGQTVVFAQDVHGPLHPSLLSNEADYLTSLQRLIDLDADILCEGHYGIFREKPDITRFIRSFMG